LFSDYTNLWDIRNSVTHLSESIWLEYLDIISNDMLALIEINLNQELITEYKRYITNNDWSNELAIRRSCKQIDMAVKFLKFYFIKLKGQKSKNVKKSHLKIVK
jgi:hypothetical protein